MILLADAESIRESKVVLTMYIPVQHTGTCLPHARPVEDLKKIHPIRGMLPSHWIPNVDVALAAPTDGCKPKVTNMHEACRRLPRYDEGLRYAMCI